MDSDTKKLIFDIIDVNLQILENLTKFKRLVARSIQDQGILEKVTDNISLDSEYFYKLKDLRP